MVATLKKVKICQKNLAKTTCKLRGYYSKMWSQRGQEDTDCTLKYCMFYMSCSWRAAVAGPGSGAWPSVEFIVNQWCVNNKAKRSAGHSWAWSDDPQWTIDQGCVRDKQWPTLSVWTHQQLNNMGIAVKSILCSTFIAKPSYSGQPVGSGNLNQRMFWCFLPPLPESTLIGPVSQWIVSLFPSRSCSSSSKKKVSPRWSRLKCRVEAGVNYLLRTCIYL